MYHCETTSVEGFVKQVVTYVSNRARYWFYVSGILPAHDGLSARDQYFIEKYDLDISRTERWRRRNPERSGRPGRPRANMQYLRYGRTILLLSTAGRGPFFEAMPEGESRRIEGVETRIRDIRQESLKLFGYWIKAVPHTLPGGEVKYKVTVKLTDKAYAAVRERYRGVACRASREEMARALLRLPFEPYSGVYHQARQLLDEVNKILVRRGISRLRASEALRNKRNTSLSPFAQVGVVAARRMKPLAAASTAGEDTLEKAA